MDIQLARTFLTIVTVGNFNAAAEHLNVTQSTISARIRSLEEYLGCTLFIRNKAGTKLTLAGLQFQKHASTLVRTLEQARQEVSLQSGFRANLTVGSRFGLWEILLQWVSWMHEKVPDISLRVEIGFEEGLMQRLVEGSLNIGVMYTPQSRPKLIVEQLMEEELVLVSTGQDMSPDDANYVYVDWGPEFFYKHSMYFGKTRHATTVAGVGWLGLQLILSRGGSGYFPMRLVCSYLDNGTLVRIPKAPTFTLPVYLVYPTDVDPDVYNNALAGLHEVVAIGRK